MSLIPLRPQATQGYSLAQAGYRIHGRNSESPSGLFSTHFTIRVARSEGFVDLVIRRYGETDLHERVDFLYDHEDLHRVSSAIERLLSGAPGIVAFGALDPRATTVAGDKVVAFSYWAIARFTDRIAWQVLGYNWAAAGLRADHHVRTGSPDVYKILPNHSVEPDLLFGTRCSSSGISLGAKGLDDEATASSYIRSIVATATGVVSLFGRDPSLWDTAPDNAEHSQRINELEDFFATTDPVGQAPDGVRAPQVRIGVVSAFMAPIEPGDSQVAPLPAYHVVGETVEFKHPLHPHRPAAYVLDSRILTGKWFSVTNSWWDTGVDQIFLRGKVARNGNSVTLEYLVVGSPLAVDCFFFNQRTHYPEFFLVSTHKGEAVLVPADMYTRRSFFDSVNTSTGPAVVRHSWSGKIRGPDNATNTVEITAGSVMDGTNVAGSHWDRTTVAMDPRFLGSNLPKIRKGFRGLLSNTSGDVSKFYVPTAQGLGLPPGKWQDGNVLTENEEDLVMTASLAPVEPPVGEQTPIDENYSGENDMPWLSIAMAILTFFMSGGAEKKNRTKALLAAGLVGLGTYYVSHETDWGKRTLGEFDGVPSLPDGSEVVRDPDGNPISDGGVSVKVPDGKKGIWDVISDWGPAGTAVVVGGGAAALTGNTKYIIWAALAIGGILLLRS